MGRPDQEGSLFETLGVRYLRSLVVGALPDAIDAVHVLNESERAALSAIERSAVIRATAAGALSGLVCALPLVLWAPVEDGAPWTEHAARWGVVGGVTVVASVVEIAYLYAITLRAVRDLAHAAGLDISDKNDAGATSMAWSLARAALEMPNPPTMVPGFDPLREASRARVLLASTLYKLKVAATGFLTKALLRRALGRAATRAVLEFVAVPVTAIWDGVTTWSVVREARLRVLGPSAAREFTAHLLEGAQLSAAGAACAVRAVGAAMVRTEDPHPNLVVLLATVQGAVAVGDLDGLDDSVRFLEELRALSPDEQTRVLRVLAAATIIDGRLLRSERRLLQEAFTVASRTVNLASVSSLRAAFVSGDPISREQLTAIA